MEYQLCKRMNGEGSSSNSPESKSLLHIPQEIIENILKRLPAKSLCRFKTVSQTWNSSISNLKFHTQSVFSIFRSSEGQFFHSVTEHGNSTEKFPVPWGDSRSTIYVSNCCNGMLLICVDTCFYLFNPSTHYSVKVLTLNYTCRGCTYNMSIGLYYDETVCDYNAVVLIRYSREYDNIILVVETSLKRKKWNKIDHTFRHHANVNVGPVLNGRIHWLVEEKITRFDPVSKVFEELPSFQPPKRKKEYSCIVGIGFLEGCLCVSRILKENKFEILAMKEYGVYESWTPIYSFSNERFCYAENCNPLLLTRADELLISLNNEIWVYNLDKLSFEKYCLPSVRYYSTCSVLFVQNMDTPNGYYWDLVKHESFGNPKHYFESIYKFWRNYEEIKALYEDYGII